MFLINMYVVLWQRTNVLKFGDWDTEENVPYTTYFENARVSSRDKVKSTSSSRNPDLETRKGSEAVRAKHENMEEGELQRSYNSQARLDAGTKASINSSHYQSAGVSSDTPKRAARADRGGFRSADHSPLHPHYQAKISAKGGAISSVEEECELQRSYDSPLRLDAGRKASINSSHYRPAGVSSGKPKRAAGGNGGGFRSADHSPLHPHYQAKISAKGGAVSSPSRERKGSSEGSHGLAPSTPGRSRLRPVPRGNDTVIYYFFLFVFS